MGLFIILLFGAIVGWIATIIDGENTNRALVRHVAIGVAGALSAALLFVAIPNNGFNLADFASAGALIFGAAGAIFAIASMKLVAHRALR